MPQKPTKVMGRRVVAFLIDLVISYAFAAIVFFAMAEKDTDIARDVLSGKLDPNETTYINVSLGDTKYSIVGGGKFFLFMALWVAFSFAIHVALQGIKGYTPGKAIMGLRTVDASGRPPGIGKAIVRWLLWIVDGFFFWIVGLVTALATENNQRVGDLVAKTYVVDKRFAGQPLPLGGAQPAFAGAPGYGGPPPVGGYPPQGGAPPVAEGAKADWYPDPHGQARLRYWDGSQWTDHTS
jgi:uncharacterized RDD family membrane protein YckC